jgi:formylglycine-generating enzyme required for sulfatase activity
MMPEAKLMNTSFTLVAVLFSAVLLSAVQHAPAVTIDLVAVGNPGNANDPATGNLYGGVSYAYSIGKYEVTVGQYTEFLNSVAAADTYGLYNPDMALDLNIAGIAQTGASGGFTYSVIGSPNHPVTKVSWGDAARFANWLHNGQPTGAQNASTTEDGAYTLNGATSNAALDLVSRNSNAQWFIPSESEWYKAAYHQPAAQGGDSDGYWAYPMKTNSIPYSDQPPGATPDNTRVGNFRFDDNIANGYDDGYAVTGSITYSGSQNYLTDVGSYTSSPSYYGTFDQGGNVFEWNEAKVGSERGFRGGSWDLAGNLRASVRYHFLPADELTNIGFRVASESIPEPTTPLLGALAGMGSLLRRRALR